ncbi:hypothetical protein FB45DRAFT_939765 [Roridomyces roridus]|uniref:Uncharacterized protein n=1 Tax=Roridomyces roridus TaxID=1738132 RepID=A0AAD7FAU9_9AGAR|nr:hypothetical protein FB45DRAFT_939765 [Roridomyces roridus]
MPTASRFLEIGLDGLYHPVLNPPAALAALPMAHDRQSSVDGVEKEPANENVPRGPIVQIKKPGRPRKLTIVSTRRSVDRAQRALYRVLVNEHGIGLTAVAREFGSTLAVVWRAAKNKYSPRDKDADAPYLPANFASILSKVVSRSGCFDLESMTESSPSSKQTIRMMRRPRRSTPRKGVRSSTRLRPKSKSPSASRSLSARKSRRVSTAAAPRKPTPTPSIPSSSPSPAPDSDFTVVTTDVVSDHEFLKNFAKTHISPDPKWCLALEKAGFTKENMARMGRFPKDRIAEFIASKFPEMSDVEQFFFVEAVGQLGV